MFGSDVEPSESEYYEAESAYGKMILRQSMATDIHVYRLLSARIASDGGTLMHFCQQDSRVAGHKQQRAQQRFNAASNEMMQLFGIVPEAITDESAVDAAARTLVDYDKQP